MNAMIFGRKHVKYTSKKSGEDKEGYSVYYGAPNPEVDGICTESMWIDAKRSPALCEQVKKIDLSQGPVDVDMNFEMVVGSRYPVLLDIQVL